MAQAASRESTITIGDKSFRVCFSIIGIVALRDLWKLESDDEVLARLDELTTNWSKGKLDFKRLSDLVWGGLQEYHPEVTPIETLRLMSAAGLPKLPEIMHAVFANLLASAPPKEARQARPRKAKNGALVSTS